MHSLPLFHRIVGQPVIVLGEGEVAEAKRRLVERAGGLVVGSDYCDARLALVAMPDPEDAVQHLRARRVLVNVADRPDLCDFTLPSILDRDPVLVAVGTGGASAGLAKALRLRLEALLPASLGALARALLQARAAMRRRWPDATERRHALDAALAQGAILDPFRDSADRVSAWLDDPVSTACETVEITIFSDDPDDLTLRQARWLGQADRIVLRGAIAPAVLARSRADAARVSADRSVDPAPGLTIILRRG